MSTFIGQENTFSFGEPLLHALMSMQSSCKIARTLTSKQFPLDAVVVFDGHYDADKDGKILFAKQVGDTTQQMKPGKFLRRVFPTITKYCSDQDIERFVNLLKSKMCNGDIEIWEGDDIVRSYKRENHYSDSGPLGCSCMNNKSYTSAYTSSSNKSLHPKVACVMKDGKIAGKSLIWDNVEVYMDGEWQTRKVMDRIYTVEDKYIQAVAEWGFMNGYIVRDERNYDERMKFYFDLSDFNTRNYRHLSMRVDSALFSEADYFPYTDTFHFDDDCYITNDDDGCYERSYCSTGGGSSEYEDEDYVTLACGERVHQDDATWVEDRGEYYCNDDVTWVGDYAYHYDDVVEDVDGDYIHNDNAVETYFGDTVHEDRIASTDCSDAYNYIDEDVDNGRVVMATAGEYEDGYILADDSVELGDGTLVHTDDDVVKATLGKYEDEYILLSDSVEIADDNIVHDDDSTVIATAGMYEGEFILEDDSVELADDIVHTDDDTVTATWGENDGLDILETLSVTIDGHIMHEDEEDDYIAEKQEREENEENE